MKKCTQVVILNENGEVLSVSRKHDHNDFGLVGGKVDEGETPLEAVIRETREETGLTFSEVTFKIEDQGLIAKIFHNVTPQDKEIQELKLKITDDVQKIVEKQMKVVQEVASLLGETTAETKATVGKLLNILKKEG